MGVGPGVGVSVGVGSGVGDDSGVASGVGVSAGVDVITGIAVGVGDDVPVGVGVGVDDAGAELVVKLQEYSELREVCAAFAACAPVVIVAVYVVLYARPDDGVNVALFPLVLTEPFTELPPPLSLKVSVVNVEPFIVSLNVAVTTVPVPTPLAPLDGLVEVTVM